MGAMSHACVSMQVMYIWLHDIQLARQWLNEISLSKNTEDV